MPVSSSRRISAWSFGLGPEKSLCIKYPKVAVVLLSIVASEDQELLVVKCRSVVLYLRSAISLCIGHILSRLHPRVGSSIVLGLRRGKDPLQLERLAFERCRSVFLGATFH